MNPKDDPTVDHGPGLIRGATGADRQESICEEADRIVSHDRFQDYGHPIDDFGKVTEAARALGIDPASSVEHHSLYMILVKMARELNNPKRDNRVDIAGYAKTLDMVIVERELRERAGLSPS